MSTTNASLFLTTIHNGTLCGAVEVLCRGGIPPEAVVDVVQEWLNSIGDYDTDVRFDRPSETVVVIHDLTAHDLAHELRAVGFVVEVA